MHRRTFFLIPLLAACQRKDSGELKQLIRDLSATDPKLRNKAALRLAAFGKEAEVAVPALIRILRTDPSKGIRSSAAYALRSIGTPEALAALESYEK